VSKGLRVALVAALSLGHTTLAFGQTRGGPPAAPSARSSAPIDLTGYWVSVVNEDWRFRMVTPPKGDYRNVPLTREAVAILNAWNPAADEAAGNQCKSYGAGAIMRVPGRLHITWQDDDTLRVDIDAGTQTRLFQFAAGPGAARQAKPSWQGTSTARWERPGGRGGGRGAPPPASGSLSVVTTNLRAGYLRKNGVPYSENARVTEHVDTTAQPSTAQPNTTVQNGGAAWLVVTTVVDDPPYLTQPFIVSSHFKKEADGSKWDPTPCSATW
jgi:hypothetical protein